MPEKSEISPPLDQISQAKETKSDWVQLEHTLKLDKESRLFGLARSFRHALSGIKETLSTERNFKIQLVCACLVVALGCFLKINLFNWLVLIQVIALVLTAELINTALEHLVDLAAGGLYHPIARAAKDAAAGAVLIASIFAVISGIFIFGPYLLPFIKAF